MILVPARALEVVEVVASIVAVDGVVAVVGAGEEVCALLFRRILNLLRLLPRGVSSSYTFRRPVVGSSFMNLLPSL